MDKEGEYKSFIVLVFHFDFDLDGAGNLKFHDGVKNSVFGRDVNDSAVNAHFKAVECCGACAARRFSCCDFEFSCWQWNWAAHDDAGSLSNLAD